MQLYRQLIYTLTGLLPPPLHDSPEALHARNLAAIAKVAALLPVNADEIDLAAQCIAARGQAEEMLRLLHQYTDDIDLTLKLSAQYGSMIRTSISHHTHLIRVQAVRQKREKIEGAVKQDARTQHVTERSMLTIAVPEANLGKPVWPEAALARAPAIATPKLIATPTATPKPILIPTATATAAAKTEETIPENETKSHHTAFETWLNMHSVDHESDGPKERKLRKTLLETIRQATQISPTR